MSSEPMASGPVTVTGVTVEPVSVPGTTAGTVPGAATVEAVPVEVVRGEPVALEPVPRAMSALERARRASDAHVRTAEQVAAFVQGIPDEVPDSTLVAEYAALLRREEAARDAREDAVAALGLSVPSEGIGIRVTAVDADR